LYPTRVSFKNVKYMENPEIEEELDDYCNEKA